MCKTPTLTAEGPGSRDVVEKDVVAGGKYDMKYGRVDHECTHPTLKGYRNCGLRGENRDSHTAPSLLGNAYCIPTPRLIITGIKGHIAMTHTHTHTHSHTRILTNTYMFTHTQSHTPTHMQTHTHKHTKHLATNNHMHIYTSTHARTRARARAQ